MKQTAVQQRLINIAIQKAGNDSEAARQLGWLTKRFNHYRLGSRCADDDAIVDLARLVGEDPQQAVIEHRAEQAKTPEMRRFWLSFGKAAASIMIAAMLSTLPAKNAYAYAQNGWLDKSYSFYYVKTKAQEEGQVACWPLALSASSGAWIFFLSHTVQFRVPAVLSLERFSQFSGIACRICNTNSSGLFLSVCRCSSGASGAS